MRPVKRYFKGSIGTPLGVLQGCAIRFPLEDLDRLVRALQTSLRLQSRKILSSKGPGNGKAYTARAQISTKYLMSWY